jgi:hypothetical protein
MTDHRPTREQASSKHAQGGLGIGIALGVLGAGSAGVAGFSAQHGLEQQFGFDLNDAVGPTVAAVIMTIFLAFYARGREKPAYWMGSADHENNNHIGFF